MADTNSTVIIDVTLNSQDATAKAQELGNSIKEIRNEQKELKKSGQETDAAYVSNAQNLRLLQAEQKAYIQIANAAQGSNNQLRAQLALLTQQYNALGDEERDTTTAGQALAINIKAISDELKKNESRIGDNRRNVGNYKDSLVDAKKALDDQKASTNAVSEATSRLPVGFQLAGQQVSALATQITNFKAAQTAAKVAQMEFTAAQNISVAATEASTVATAQATAIGFKFTQGEATAAEVELARAAATDAATVATAAQTAATEAQVVATGAATNATKVFKVALASTGIGAIVIIVVALLSYLSKFDPIMDKIEQAFSAVGAIITRVTKIVVDFFMNLKSVGDFMSKIGSILADPIGSFNKLSDSMQEAATAAINLKKAQQDLEDQQKIQEVSNAKALQQIQQLTLQARNRALSEKERQALLAKAAKLDQENFNQKAKLVEEEKRQAVEQIAITADLTTAEKKLLDQRGIEYAFVLKERAAVTDEEVDALKAAELKRYEILTESTNRQEKLQNQSDALAEKAAAAEEKRQAKIQQAREKAADAEAARLQSQLNASAGLISARDKELDDLDREINEKIRKYKAYGRTVEQLEKERTARQAQINKEYDKENQENTKAALEAVEDIHVASIRDQGDRELMEIAVTNRRKLEAQDELIRQTLERQQMGEQGLTDLLAAQQLQREAILSENQAAINLKNEEAAQALKTKEIERDEATKEAKQKIRDEEIAAQDAAISLVQQIFDKNTAIGKAAFLAEKAFAVARIVINTQAALAANRLAEQIANASLSAIPFGGIALAIANSIKAQAERTRITIAGALSAGAVIATAIQGFDQGGVFQSDGRGAVLPGYSKRDNTNAKLRSGEAVIVAEAARDPRALAALSSINQAFGGRSLVPTTGGLALGGIAQGGFASEISDQTNSLIDVAGLAQPAPVVGVQDIITAQQRVVKTEENRTL